MYGPRMDAFGAYTTVIHQWIRLALEGKPFTVFGNPDEKILDLLYVSDAVDALVLLGRKNRTNDVYNLSSGKGVTLRELAELISKLVGAKLRLNIKPENRIDIEKARVGDLNKLQNIGWSPKISLEEGLLQVIKEHKCKK